MVSVAKVEKVECSRLRRNRHSVGESNYHLQFTPNFRGTVFLPKEVRELCKQAFEQKAAQLGVVIYSVNFGPDHCHLFVGNCRKYSVEKLVHDFKGYSSYVIRKHLWPVISQYVWGERFWSEGYFYESTGRVTSQSVQFYIERQQGKHWTEEELLSLEKPEDRLQKSLSAFF
jgi:REP element-mobilizing transposase RayT